MIFYFLLFLPFLYAQPITWTDICYRDGTDTCYLWGSNPFPFNSLQQVLDNPLCRINCTVRIIPVALLCNYSGQGSYSSLTTGCADNVENYFKINGPAIAMNRKSIPEIEMKWDIPIVIRHPGTTINTLFSYTGFTSIQVWSQTHALFPKNVSTCTAFQINAPNVKLEGISFVIDPQCPSTDGLIRVTNLKADFFSFFLIRASFFLNQLKSPARAPLMPFPILFLRDITASITVAYVNIIDTVRAFPYDVVAINVGGSIINDFTEFFLLGTAVADPSSKTPVTNSSKYINVQQFRGCLPSPYYSNSACNKKKTVNLALIITIAVVGFLVLVYYAFRIYRHFQLDHLKLE